MTRDSGGPRLVHTPKYTISDPWLQGWPGRGGEAPRGCGCAALGAQFRGDRPLGSGLLCPLSSPASFLRVLSPVPARGVRVNCPRQGGAPSGAGRGLPLPDRSGHWAPKGDLGPEVGEEAHPGERGKSGNSEGPSWLQRVGRWDLPQPPAPGLQVGWEGGGAERGAWGRRAERKPAQKCRAVSGCGEHRVGVLGVGCPQVCCPHLSGLRPPCCPHPVLQGCGPGI